MSTYLPRSNKTTTTPRYWCLECDWHHEAAGVEAPTDLARAHAIESGHRVKGRVIHQWDLHYCPDRAES